MNLKSGVITILNHFFFLPEGIVLVEGAKYSVLADFNRGELYRINKTATCIIELGENGCRLAESTDFENLEINDLLQFIKDLENMGLIRLSSKPKPEKNPDYPEHGLDFMWIEVTARCNLNCLHCYADGGTKQIIDPPAEEIISWLNQGAEMGCKRLQFTGGECTIREDLDLLIKHAKKTGYEFIEVMSNCTLLTEEIVRFFAENNINVALCLHSHRPEIHDSITGIPGSHNRIMNSLKLLQDYKVPIRCEIIAMNNNEDNIDETRRFLSEMGIKSRTPFQILPVGRGKNIQNWSRKYQIKSIRTEPDFKIDLKAYERGHTQNSCWSGTIAITSNGNVLPCTFAREQIAGNIRTHSLSEIINGRMQDFWRLSKDHVETCKDCEYRYFCHDCRPWAYSNSGNLYAKSPMCTYNPYDGEWGIVEEMKHNNRS